MRKLVFLLVCLFTLQTVAHADDDKPIQVTQMPQPAQQFIKRHFANSKVALAKMESDFFYKSYEVIFTNGDKVEFNNKGEWTENRLQTYGHPRSNNPHSYPTICNDQLS